LLDGSNDAVGVETIVNTSVHRKDHFMNQANVVDKRVSKLKHERSDGGDAFIPESAQISGAVDDLAELLGEEYLREASGDESDDGARDDVVPEELGGPFVESGPQEEYGATRKGRENSYPMDDDTRWFVSGPTRNPLPQAVGSLAIAAPDEDAENFEDEGPEKAGNESPLAASEARQASLGAESGSRMEPAVEIEQPSPLDDTAEYPSRSTSVERKR
jgi:hypothetical protein